MEQEIIEAWLAADYEYDLDLIKSAYKGKWNSDREFAQVLLSDRCENLPHHIHIDWEATTREVMYYYFESNGHYFRLM